MKVLVFLGTIALVFSLAVNSYTVWTILSANEVQFPGVKLFHGDPDDGRLVLMGRYPGGVTGGSTALDMWPVNDTLPQEHALTEHVLYRTRIQDWPNFERMNWTAMADNSPSYRFGVERGGTGQFRDMIFCFEDVTPGMSACKFKITLDGIFVRRQNTWHQIGD